MIKKQLFVTVILMCIFFWFTSGLKLTRALIKKNIKVPFISQAELSKKIKDKTIAPIIFDIREKVEYEISHIKGAVNVNPATSAEQFWSQYEPSGKTKDMVFYCSVGYRSAKFIEKLQGSVSAEGRHLYNLDGGLFYWAQKKNLIVNKEGVADKAHPYNFFWGLLR